MTKTNVEKETLLDVRLDILACLFLVVSTLAVYGQVRNYEFVNYDDTVYVIDNSFARSGLTRTVSPGRLISQIKKAPTGNH